MLARNRPCLRPSPLPLALAAAALLVPGGCAGGGGDSEEGEASDNAGGAPEESDGAGSEGVPEDLPDAACAPAREVPALTGADGEETLAGDADVTSGGTVDSGIGDSEQPENPPEFVITPYVQDVGPSSAWILWETTWGHEARVEYGLDADLGEVADGEVVPLEDWLDVPEAGVLHAVELTGLEPGTVYHYRALTEGAVSEPATLRTAAGDPEASLRFLAVSDMQRDDAHPEKWGEVVEEGVISWLGSQVAEPLVEALDLVLIAGDLVDNGWIFEQWSRDFFAPAAALLAHVPAYPVLGNHESSSPFYHHYFHLPGRGALLYPEQWWSFDRANVRFLGLDSNPGPWNAAQLPFLDEELDGACHDEAIDFVFVELHHPHRSELWIPGNTDWTGEVVSRLEAFSTACGKPSIHFFGHTHGYSRGQSRDHDHLMVNVATAGGKIDAWGAFEQTDYEEFSVSRADYGFVIVDVEAGEDPGFTLRRISRGDLEAPLDNELRDEVAVRRFNLAPAAPEAGAATLAGGEGSSLVLVASAFKDLDGDDHQASHWQIGASCEGLEEPLWQSWRQRQNWYQGVDLQADDDLTDEVLADTPTLEAIETAAAPCWRVRYRDSSLGWSPWSETVPLL